MWVALLVFSAFRIFGELNGIDLPIESRKNGPPTCAVHPFATAVARTATMLRVFALLPPSDVYVKEAYTQGERWERTPLGLGRRSAQ